MKIILSGGGTLGPVTPLLAIRETIQKQYPDAQFLWVGTKRGPERELLQELGIEFTTLASGKFRRYLSLWNVIDIARIFIGFFQSLRLLLQEIPMCVSRQAVLSQFLFIGRRGFWVFPHGSINKIYKLGLQID